jgi:ABC-2 type transport system ATP-binding protein
VRIDRVDVSKTLAALLSEHTIEDVVVEDPPLEEVIANVFSSVRDDEDVEPKPEISMTTDH